MSNLIPKENINLTKAGATNDALVAAFLSGRCEKTILAYRADLKDLQNFIGAATLSETAAQVLRQNAGDANALVLAYKGQLLARNLKAATINRRLASLRSLVKLARTFGLVNWTLEVSNAKSTTYRDTRGPGRTGFQKILDGISSSNPKKAARDSAILRLLHDLGLRRGEVIALDLADVDLNNSAIAIISKGYTDKTILTLPNVTQITLEIWIGMRGSSPGPLFTNFDRTGKGCGRLVGSSIYRLVRRLGDAAGIKTRPHGIRHTAITEAIKAAQTNGVGLEEVRDFSRHADVRTLMIYRDRERNVQGKLAELVAALHPIQNAKSGE